MVAHQQYSILLSRIRRRPYLIPAVLLSVLFLAFVRRSYSSTTLRDLRGAPVKPVEELSSSSIWSWNYARDANSLFLTEKQCDRAFPELFTDLDRLVRRRKKNPITRAELEVPRTSNGYVRAMIYDRDLYIITTGADIHLRASAVLSQIYRAIVASSEPIPNTEFTFSVDDRLPSNTPWTFARQKGDTANWLIPDFEFWTWPETSVGSVSDVRRKAIVLETSNSKPGDPSSDDNTVWQNKVPKLLWRDATMGVPLRDALVRATAGKAWADVKGLDWHNETSVQQDIKSMHEHCRYKFLAHTEGHSYSDLLKYLQQCQSVIISHPQEWVTHYSHLMRPSGQDQNFVEVKRDWSDLESKVKGLLGYEPLAERIAGNNVRIFRERYLTPAAEVCYWRRLIRGWREVSFEPDFLGPDGAWRGMPYESYILKGRMQ